MTASNGSSGSITDWISASSSLVAAIIASLTLLALYQAAIQILSRRQLYRLGICTRSLGPWKTRVVSPSLLKMQTQIYTPTVSLCRLVKKGWEPTLTFPRGFDIQKPGGSISDPEDCLGVLAETSWVNFLQAIGLTPEAPDFYQMQSEPELVNGIVPMRWKGPDLVAICSVLGFQSAEKKPSFKDPMPLPMQWSGPIGWLQFRASSDGCIVEYRRRAIFKDEISSNLHEYYRDRSQQPFCLKSRLWQSINGLYLPDGSLLYLGGTDKCMGRKQQPRSADDICDELLSSDLSDDEMIKLMYGKKANKPDAIRSAKVDDEKPTGLLEQLDSLVKKKSAKKMEVLEKCPGLLTCVVQGELANCRGLDLTKALEYRRRYVDLDEVNSKTHPHRLGMLCLDEPLLRLVKSAVLRLKPDGYFFVPTAWLRSDLKEIFEHVDSLSEKVDEIFPSAKLEDWFAGVRPAAGKDSDSVNSRLYHAILLCNQLQKIRQTARAVFTVEDMRLFSRASKSLSLIIAPSADYGVDLMWAMLVCPDFFSDLLNDFGDGTPGDVLKAAFEAKDGSLTYKLLSGSTKLYRVPLIQDGKYDGSQVLAAFLDIYLTYSWVEKCWITDVSVYDPTVPQSVIMC